MVTPRLALAPAGRMSGSELTLVDVLGRRAESEAERIAYTFLVDGEGDERALTYAELDAEARRIAVALAAHGGSERERCWCSIPDSTSSPGFSGASSRA